MTADTQRYTWSFGIILGAILATLLLLPEMARSELLVNDTNALDDGVYAWHGSRNVTGQLSKKLAVTINFAVYEPGHFNLSFQNQAPIYNSLYVYAYQLINQASPASTDSINTFTIGTDGNESIANISQIVDPNITGVNFSGQHWDPSQVVLNFTTTTIAPNARSNILIFTSPYGPEWDSAALSGFYGTPASTNHLPTKALPSPKYQDIPTPEPATLLGLAVAGGLFILVRPLRRAFIKRS